MNFVPDQSSGQMIRFELNGKPVSVGAPGAARLATVLRDEIGLTGTKIGCNAGDCGACTVLLDGAQICACLTPVGQVSGRSVQTIEGHGVPDHLSRLQDAFLARGAAQCGICTPGMLMAAQALLEAVSDPTDEEIRDALGGVLCRCTGYSKIFEAVAEAARSNSNRQLLKEPSVAVGTSIQRVDGVAKVCGTDQFGADTIPAEALMLRVLRAPCAAGVFSVGDMSKFISSRPGLAGWLGAADVPYNAFGIYPDLKDQPVLADGIVRYRGEAIIAIYGEQAAIDTIDLDSLPVQFKPHDAVSNIESARAAAATELHSGRDGNLLIEGYVRSGDFSESFRSSAHQAEGQFETAFVEHAYIEPEAGWARRVGDRLEITVSTQTPYMDRDEVASVMKLPPESIRILPTACGGGFGGKLDQSVQLLLAIAAWRCDRPVTYVYDRPESMVASTKRHASTIHAQMACDANGNLTASSMVADFDTGAYASWGPTVAGRVPVHASGPYRVQSSQHIGRAYYTNNSPAGAFRGFGVPQAAIAHECLMDDLALAVGQDRLDFRFLNALRTGDHTGTGQRLEASVGLTACLDALRPYWRAAISERKDRNKALSHMRRGIGIGCMWYGIGNTALSNPSTMRVCIDRAGRLTLFSGAVDIGQGSNTVMTQICADALGLPAHHLKLVTGDTDRTLDAGKTSASRQTFVSGRAAQLAGESLRQQILRHANSGADSVLALDGPKLLIRDGRAERVLDLTDLAEDEAGFVLTGQGYFDPPTEPLDENGQGKPYATYAFAAQMAVVDVDTELGTVSVKDVIAAHDVGRAINPNLVEGQIEGGIAQGLGLALMEEYIPGRTENLHDYLIPTIGDMPNIDVILIEDAEPLGPFGAKGVGEPGLVPTAPAILGAIRDATGVRCTRVPVLPHRLHAWLREARKQ